ncbi:methyltransferase domain-containing protein [Roseisolibacter sp. H3M3-2]|uniref:class I SAM-dependent methyltransferase n=1 Tax=Roseisolibacter sp. H3M3-2 TaxID=3031323 RepID=UPI0023DAC16D|nr:methyltransferase domain-containing protein [Roseisolibacter sp. H3M3-2]MDF1505047.1 methyltransferase domain-containing protein [Roseisolibacter sp. H3M3-2]
MEMLETTAGDFPLQEYRLRLGGREWSVLHTEALLSFQEEQDFLGERRALPYGVVLWSASIALAHDVAARAADLRGRTVLELGAGTGLPGIVAASLGARVVQTDKQAVALAVCRRNGARNGVAGVEYRQADWDAWTDAARYDWILGADVLYADGMHDRLRRIFDANLAPGGRLLLADPFRPLSFRLLEAMERDGWTVGLSRWTIGEGEEARRIGVYELRAPGGAP